MYFMNHQWDTKRGKEGSGVGYDSSVVCLHWTREWGGTNQQMVGISLVFLVLFGLICCSI